jgi:hypothetical protein
LDAESCRNPAEADGGDWRGPLTRPRGFTVDVPKGTGGGLHLALLTSVNVFGSVVLGDFESGLTCPRVLFDLGRVSAGARVEFAYRLGARPGFEYRFI